jgi:hypothetical protein
MGWVHSCLLGPFALVALTTPASPRHPSCGMALPAACEPAPIHHPRGWRRVACQRASPANTGQRHQQLSDADQRAVVEVRQRVELDTQLAQIHRTRVRGVALPRALATAATLSTVLIRDDCSYADLLPTDQIGRGTPKVSAPAPRWRSRILQGCAKGGPQFYECQPRRTHKKRPSKE